MTKRRWLWVAIVAVPVLAVAGILLQGVVVYRDFAFVCENTGSRHGYRVGLFGNRSNDWYKASPLEEFVKREAPAALEHRWTSYAGTGKNLWGDSILFGHGAPGALLDVKYETLSVWISDNDRQDVLGLYESFRDSSPAESREIVEWVNIEAAKAYSGFVRRWHFKRSSLP